MLKESGYDEKVELLQKWLPQIIETVKKDLKNEHLKIDKAFCRKYFMGKNVQQVTLDQLSAAYYQDIREGNVGLGEFIASRWLLKNTDIYGFFEESLKAISDDFDELETLSEAQAAPLVKGAIDQFGATKTYLFSVLNSVVFPEAIYSALRSQAFEESDRIAQEREQAILAESLEMMQKRHRREMDALADRYEKKLNGMQRKYLRDMEILKNQVRKLQKES